MSRKFGLEFVGIKLSKLRCRFVMLEGVLTLLLKAVWAGLGVMLTKSENSKAWEGVLGLPKGSIPEPPPGVVIIDEGRARFLGGGVDGGSMRERDCAGEGEVAR